MECKYTEVFIYAVVCWHSICILQCEICPEFLYPCYAIPVEIKEVIKQMSL